MEEPLLDLFDEAGVVVDDGPDVDGRGCSTVGELPERAHTPQAPPGTPPRDSTEAVTAPSSSLRQISSSARDLVGSTLRRARDNVRSGIHVTATSFFGIALDKTRSSMFELALLLHDGADRWRIAEMIADCQRVGLTARVCLHEVYGSNGRVVPIILIFASAQRLQKAHLRVNLERYAPSRPVPSFYPNYPARRHSANRAKTTLSI